MSQKIEKPTLSGQRIKTRKRDEKEKYDPSAFRDTILQGLCETGGDLEAVSKFLDTAGSKLDYRRYGEVLFDILIAGGILAPGGTVVLGGDGGPADRRSEVCVFATPPTAEAMRAFAQLLNKLVRRYKYLEKMLEDEMCKVLMFLRGFSTEERRRLALFTAVLLANGLVSASVLASLVQENVVKDGVSLEFIIDVFQTWTSERDMSSITAVLKKASFDSRLMEFFPMNKRTPEIFEKTFRDKGLGQIVEFQLAQLNAGVKRELQKQLSTMMHNEEPVKEMIQLVRDYQTKHALPEHETAVLVWNTLMAAVEWNKKEELVAEQALRHLKIYAPLLQATAQQPKAELALLVRSQEYCFENMNFMKVFQKIVVLLYKTEVLSEDVILKWYREAHSAKGKSVFLEQMKKFVEWLHQAEEESESEGED